MRQDGMPYHAVADFAGPSRWNSYWLRSAEARFVAGRQGAVVCEGVQSRIFGMCSRRISVSWKPTDSGRCNSRVQQRVRGLYSCVSLRFRSDNHGFRELL
jgi:hypothetical protein